MITIDFIDENVSKTEKPIKGTNWSDPKIGMGVLNSMYSLVQDHRLELLQAAHTARLLKTEDGPAIDVQRLIGQAKSTAFTLAERYVRRSR